MRTALIAGATGLIGRQLLDLLLADQQYEKVIAITRRPLPFDSKLTNIIADSSQVSQLSEQLVADDVFCCLGTTMGKAKSKSAFRKIDYDYPLLLADVSYKNGAKQFLLVSALGANANSAIFYNKVKGEAERDILKMAFESISILRPSLLLGERVENRPAEKTATKAYKFLNFIIPRKYKAIDSLRVARALHSLALQRKKGQFVYESSLLQDF